MRLFASPIAAALLAMASSALAGDGWVRADVATAAPLEAGRGTDCVLTLRFPDGQPVAPDDLKVTHTERVHLLIVDSSLADYHHIHPQPASEPGRYEFRFAPARPGVYKLFADIWPEKADAPQQPFAFLETPGEGAPVEKTLNNEAEAAGLRFKMSIPSGPLRAGEDFFLTVNIAGEDKKPFMKLEPVMGAYAHLVGFSENRVDVVHAHPVGAEPRKESDRGGPSLTFHVRFDEPGFYRLFAQVKVDGRDVFAPFGVQVEPAAHTITPPDTNDSTAPDSAAFISGGRAAHSGHQGHGQH